VSLQQSALVKYCILVYPDHVYGGLFITVNAHRAGRQWTVANGTEPLRRLDDRYGRYRTIPARPEPSRAERGNYL
jgi:hypothetical protein